MQRGAKVNLDDLIVEFRAGVPPGIHRSGHQSALLRDAIRSAPRGQCPFRGRHLFGRRRELAPRDFEGAVHGFEDFGGGEIGHGAASPIVASIRARCRCAERSVLRIPRESGDPAQGLLVKFRLA